MTTPPPQPRLPARGFTLLEMLIALAVMAMIALTLGATFSAAGRLVVRSAEMSLRADAALARARLRQVVEQALTAPFPGTAAVLFQGDATGFSFLTEAEAEGFWPGAPVQAALVAGPGGGLALHLSGRAEKDRAPLVQDWPIAPPGLSWEIGYFGARTAGAPLMWHRDWSPNDGLPRLVKLSPLAAAGAVLPDLPPPLVLQPAKARLQSERSLSSLVPPATPSRP
jgi:prepilin-type N-terminal cleavage/methylation domain-containing protein